MRIFINSEEYQCTWCRVQCYFNAAVEISADKCSRWCYQMSSAVDHFLHLDLIDKLRISEAMLFRWVPSWQKIRNVAFFYAFCVLFPARHEMTLTEQCHLGPLKLDCILWKCLWLWLHVRRTSLLPALVFLSFMFNRCVEIFRAGLFMWTVTKKDKKIQTSVLIFFYISGCTHFACMMA